ncbi:unnamed protein product [Linum tenue]|uniref:Ionotropic glutamate receptor C-terminal domain-containing protein n=1 Tax=Linum tenue TaxID=586396 RepID=A0AAV0GUK9_9ROSI|nr:unnamed protein product [Linum tenue]
MFFATVYYAAIIDITPVPGQSSSNNATVGMNVANFLDFNRADVVRQVEPSCVEMAISDPYGWQPNYTARLLINTRDSRRVEVVQAAASAPNNVQVQAILGPETSIEANCMIAVREKAQVHITSFSESSPTVASIGSPYFFRATQNDSTQATAIAKSVDRQQSIPIDNAFGQCIVPSLVDTIEAVDACVPYRSSIFHSSNEVVNVHGNGARVAAFWTSGEMLVKELMNSSTWVTSSPLREILGPMIWPGDRAMAPKESGITTRGKKLRIGVPMRDGFSEFVSVTTDPETNKTSVTGYSIDVFEAVVLALPYALPFEYVPFAGTYGDLVYQVFLGNFDAVVGDITIIADRSKYVDFALPYTESGVSMVVPAKPNGSKNPWLFLKPLTWNVWVTVFFLFLFIGFVVWVFEHRMISKDFRGPPSHKAGIWFSFSAMVFAHRENVASNLARTVVIMWCFVVLIMTMSYTASFTNLQTMQRLQPTTAADMNELLRKGEFVGYQDGSFVRDLLKQLGFRDDRLVPYHNLDECDSLFGQGKIAAAFDEVPYMKLFLAKHSPKYTMINPTYKTGGFGFVFPKGSPLVPDISRAVLNVAEGDKMAKIEEARNGKKRRRWLEEYSTSVSSENQLGLESFWCLFLIAGVVATVSALCIFAAVSIYKHRKLPVPAEEDDSQSNPSFWRRILNPFTICYKINPTCHTSRDDRVGTEVHLANMNAMTPSAFSVRMDFSMDSPQSPTPLIESLWIQPTNLLR